jgi:tetratricopeptide (TPR) repeat protein
LERGKLQAGQGNFAAARIDLDRAVAIDPKNVRALLSHARLLEQQGNLDLALQDVEQALAVKVDNIETLTLQARLLNKKGDTATAQAVLERARSLQPKNTALVLREVTLLAEQGRPEEALSRIRSAIGDGADPLPLYVAAGRLRYSLGDYARARANYNAAVNTAPENGPAFYGLALCERKLGNRLAAVTAFQTYLRLEPNAPERPEIEAWLAKQ